MKSPRCLSRKASFPRLGVTWQQVRKARFQEHFDALNPLYFEKAMQRLKGLTDWAAGRAKQLRPEAASAPAVEPSIADSIAPLSSPSGGQ